MTIARNLVLLSCAVLALVTTAQPYGKPDTGAPGDAMIQAYLKAQAAKLDAAFADDLVSREAWEAKRAQRYEEYMYMLGLSPRPERTPLKATVTRTLDKGDYAVDMLHYQSVPGLYVTGNLYRPAKVKEGEKLPAILYVCGHSGRGRDGNKVAYQSHGIWFARHGYVCLVVDTLQLGEIAAKHHGTYNLGRWWWHSRGYTPAGVEAWNGVRGIDYLVSRPDVDADRIAVTGISGGGAATFWVSAADDRVKVAVPVSGMADLEAYVGNRVINGHCDCMFLYNAYQWPWTRIAALVAPRATLFTNSDKDAIFPMDANERIITRLERLYSLYGAGDRVDTFVSVGGHAYREDIRKGAYRFINANLKDDARAIADSEVDIVSEGMKPGPYPIPPETLRVFPTDADLPADQLNTKIDESFVPMAKVDPPAEGKFDAWRKDLSAKLRKTTFNYFPDPIPLPTPAAGTIDKTFGSGNWDKMKAEEGIEFRFKVTFSRKNGAKVPSEIINPMIMVVLNEDEAGDEPPAWVDKLTEPGQHIVLVEPRGIGGTRWTVKDPPNYIARSHVLLGRTIDSGRVLDVLAAVRIYNGKEHRVNIHLAGRGPAGVIAAYAAALDDSIASVTLIAPPTSHMDAGAPQFLNVLRVCDLPDALGLIAPRVLTITGGDGATATTFARTKSAYTAAGAADRLTLR